MESATTFETRQNPWWLLLMGGILSIVVGILFLANPIRTTITFAWVLGLYWFVQGIFILIAMFLDHSAWGWKLFMGVIGILAGIFVMRHPIASAIALPAVLILFLGIQGLVTGAIELVMALKGGGWGMGVWGALSIVFGVILILNWTSPSMILTFIWVIAVFAIIGGIAQIFQAFRQRR
jgi:uncharacterized membrane protein HdeD (DUF308 family)